MSAVRLLPRWCWPVLSLETRKTLAYRLDFWVSFVGSVLAHVGIAYFLWRAVFAAKGVSEMGGFNFHALMLYYLLVPTIDRMVRGQEMGFMSVDIYEGSLSRYLIYPVSFYGYKYVSQLSYVVMAALQIAVGLLLFIFFFGIPDGIQLHLSHFLWGMGAALLANYLYYAIATTLEQAAFWADNVWSLLVMLRFTISLLGGGLIPLSLYPEKAQAILRYTPFPGMLAFPVQTIMGKTTGLEWLHGMAVMGVWAIVFSILSWLVWRRGIRQYSGVGL